MSRWLLRAPATAGGEWQWYAPDGNVAGVGTAVEFAQARAAQPVRPVWLLLPAAQVLTVAAAVPQRQQRQMQAALPFLVEESLAGDIDDCHVVAGWRLDERRLQLVAVDRAVLAAALDALRAVGIDPPLATGEALALPLPVRGATVLLDGADSLLATTDGQTLAFDQADAAAIAALLAVGAGDQVQVFLGPRGDALAARALESELLAGVDEAAAAPAVAVDETPRDRYALFADALAARMPPNLRQGAFAVAGDAGFSLGFNWRPLAWLAGCWLLLALGYQFAVGISHARAAAAVHEQQVALYRQLFPGAKNVPQPRSQMEGMLRGGAGGVSFTALVAKTADTLAALGGKDPGRYQPRTIGWDAAQGELRVDVVARGLEDIEPLRAALQQQGLAVEVGTGVSQPGGYKARLNIGMAGDGGGR